MSQYFSLQNPHAFPSRSFPFPPDCTGLQVRRWLSRIRDDSHHFSPPPTNFSSPFLFFFFPRITPILSGGLGSEISLQGFAHPLFPIGYTLSLLGFKKSFRLCFFFCFPPCYGETYLWDGLLSFGFFLVTHYLPYQVFFSLSNCPTFHKS